MTDRELIQVVATHQGWTRLYFDEDTDSLWGIPTQGLPPRTGGFAVLAQELPPWLTSLDATKAVVETLDSDKTGELLLQWSKIYYELVREGTDHKDATTFQDVYLCASGSARQRIEACVTVWEREENG